MSDKNHGSGSFDQKTPFEPKNRQGVKTIPVHTWAEEDKKTFAKILLSKMTAQQTKEALLEGLGFAQAKQLFSELFAMLDSRTKAEIFAKACEALGSEEKREVVELTKKALIPAHRRSRRRVTTQKEAA